MANANANPVVGVYGKIPAQADFTRCNVADFSRLGLDVLAPRQSRRRFAYACLDWTERRPHLGGWLGAQLCDRAIEGKWVVKGPGSRAVSITPSGIRALRRHLGVAVSNAG